MTAADNPMRTMVLALAIALASATLVLAVLKLTGVIAWPWWGVAAPLVVLLVIVALMLVSMLLVGT